MNSQNAETLSQLSSHILVLIMMDKDLPSVKKLMVALEPVFTKGNIFSTGRQKIVSIYKREI